MNQDAKKQWKSLSRTVAVIATAIGIVACITKAKLPTKKAHKPPPLPPIQEANKLRAALYVETNTLVGPQQPKTATLIWVKGQEITIIEYATNLAGPWRLLVATNGNAITITEDKQQCFFRFYPQN